MKKKIIAALSVLVILILLFIFLMAKPSDNNEQNVSGPNVPVFSVQSDSIYEIDVNVSGDYYELIKNDGVWSFKGEDGVRVIQPKAEGIVYDLSNLYAESLVEKDASDFTMYGLEPAVSTVVVRLNDGAVHTFFVGNRVQNSSDYYFATDKDRNVYRIGAGKGMVLTYKKQDLVSKSMHEIYKGDIDEITLTRNDGAYFNIKQNFESQTEEWILTKPFVWPTDATALQSKLMNFVVGMSARSYVDGLTDDEMGLSKPRVHIAILKTDGTTHNFYVGNTTDDGTYVRVDAVKNVGLVDNEVTKLANVTAFDIMNKYIKMADYYAIKGVKINGDIDLTLDYQKKNSTLNSDKISDETAISLYSAICNLKVNAEAKTTDKGEQILDVTFNYGDFDYNYKVYEFDGRNYTMTHDGNNFFLIRKEAYNNWKQLVLKYI